ncbi:PQQ-binding-like beta-propeller repeat protein, partial [Candidatus Margulisiibacteriota bacterium]
PPPPRLSKRGTYIRPEGEIHRAFSPAVVLKQVIIASDQGVIKELNADTKKTKLVAKIPLVIEEGDLYGWTNYIVTGKHKRTDKHYNCIIDMKTRRLKGIIKKQGLLWHIRDFAIYSEKNSILVVSPMRGRVVYTQKVDHTFTRQVKSSHSKQYILFNDNNEIVELILPEWAIALLFVTTQPQKGERKKSILNFRTITELKSGLVPNYLNGKTVYYHTKNSIGCLDFKHNETLWTYDLPKAFTKVHNPEEQSGVLVYLVSSTKPPYQGKVLAIDKKNGKLLWSTNSFAYKQYKPVIYKKLVLAPGKDGDLVFYDLKSGEEIFEFPLGGQFTTPYIEHSSIYVQTPEKLFRFDYR